MSIKKNISKASLAVLVVALAACATEPVEIVEVVEPEPVSFAYTPPLGEACLAVWMIDATEHLGEVHAQGGVTLDGGEPGARALHGGIGCLGVSPRLGPLYMEAEYQGGNWWRSEAWLVQALCSRSGAIGGEAVDADTRCERNVAMLG